MSPRFPNTAALQPTFSSALDIPEFHTPLIDVAMSHKFAEQSPQPNGLTIVSDSIACPSCRPSLYSV